MTRAQRALVCAVGMAPVTIGGPTPDAMRVSLASVDA